MRPQSSSSTTGKPWVVMQMVGPILLDEAKALPADLQAFLDEGVSSPHAAVYASMGTLARLTEEEVQSMAAAFSALPNPVLWKLDRAFLPGRVSPPYLC